MLSIYFISGFISYYILYSIYIRRIHLIDFLVFLFFFYRDVSLDADVYKLPLHWIVPAELYEFQETSRDSATVADNKMRYRNYILQEHDYWKVGERWLCIGLDVETLKLIIYQAYRKLYTHQPYINIYWQYFIYPEHDDKHKEVQLISFCYWSKLYPVFTPRRVYGGGNLTWLVCFFILNSDRCLCNTYWTLSWRCFLSISAYIYCQ